MGVYRFCKSLGSKFMVWIFMGSNLSLGGPPQENLEIWSALVAILGLF